MRVQMFKTAAASAVFVLALGAHAQVSKAGTTTTAVHIAGPTLNSSDYYGSGNDDAFAEYGVTTFNFTQGDFGGPVPGIGSASLQLTVNDRAFSDGDVVEFFFTPDTAAVLGGGFANLSFDAAFVSGINAAHFATAPVSLGVFPIAEMAGRAGGEIDTFALAFSGAAHTALVNAINTGTEFQILVAATIASHDITYSGVGNTFDPGDPTLTLTPVPEPVSLAALGLGALGLLRRRRRA